MSSQSLSSAARPGSFLPSRYSRRAPPPVEMWPNAASSKPSVRTAAAESPPPTTVRPSTSVSAWATARVPLGERRRPRRRPSGRSRRPSSRRRAPRRTARRTPGRCPGPSASAGIASAAGTTRGWGSASADGNAVATTTSVGQHDLDAALRGLGEVAPTGVELVLLEQALADLVALGLEEGEHHAAADEQPVGLVEQVVDDAELVGDLGAAEHDDVGALGVVGEPPQHVDLGRDQAARAVRQPQRDVVHAGVLAVHGAEAVGRRRRRRARRAGRRTRRARRRPCWSRRR